MAEKPPQEMESERWAGEIGEKWNTCVGQFEGMIAPVGRRHRPRGFPPQ